MMRLQRRLEIVLAVQPAVEEWPLHDVGRLERRPRLDATEVSMLATAPCMCMSGSTRTFGSFRCGRDSMPKFSTTPSGSSRSSSGVPSGPNGLDHVRMMEVGKRHGRPLDGERHQQTQAVAKIVAVADDGEPDLAILQPGHGRRQEARVEEDVRLDGARAEIVEFLDQVEAGGSRVDRQAAGRPVVFQRLDMRLPHTRAAIAGEFRQHVACRTAADLFEQGRRGHRQTFPVLCGGRKMTMAMPSLRHAVNDRAVASKAIDTAVAVAAPQRPKYGMSTMLSPILTTSVRA